MADELEQMQVRAELAEARAAEAAAALRAAEARHETTSRDAAVVMERYQAKVAELESQIQVMQGSAAAVLGTVS